MVIRFIEREIRQKVGILDFQRIGFGANGGSGDDDDDDDDDDVGGRAIK